MRLIDAHFAAEQIKNSDLPNHWKDAFLSCLSSVPTIAPPPNDPLTLKELREMDGKPVWIVEYPDWGHWELSGDAEDYVQDRDPDFYGMKHDDPCGKFGLHALGWLAYRRKPEEVHE